VAGGRVFDPTACMRAVVHSRSICRDAAGGGGGPGGTGSATWGPAGRPL